MDLSVQKETWISIHRQLVTQLSLQIAAGILKPGSKLMSIRALSRRLDVHYNTCLGVYQELATMGLVEIKQGSGVYVKDFPKTGLDSTENRQELAQIVDYFIQVVHQCGYNWEETLQALNETYQRFSTQQRRVFFVDVHPDILPVFQAELKAGLGMPVEAIAIDDIEPGMFTAQDYLLVSRYHYHGLQQKLDRHLNLIVVDVATGGESAKRIQALPEGALVVVVSRSATFLEMSEALITSLRGQSLLIRLIPESEGMEEITRAVEHADWVIFDSVVYGTLPVTVKKPHSIVHLIPSHEMQRIRQQIPLEKPLQSEPG